jgi:hypothetical protein
MSLSELDALSTIHDPESLRSVMANISQKSI